MKSALAPILFLLLPFLAACAGLKSGPSCERDLNNPITIDFSEYAGIEFNALGPQVVCADPVRSRIFVACANSSALAIIEKDDAGEMQGVSSRGCPAHRVTTVPLGSRMPRRLRDPGMIVSPESGELFLLGLRRLFIVDPPSGVRKIDLPGDYEAMALDELHHRAYLAGRTCADLAIVDAESGKVDTIPCMEPAPPLPFMAASAPPPIRFPFVVPEKKRAYVLDGCTATLITIDLTTLEKIGSRPLPVEAMPRWHVAGFDEEREIVYAVLENGKREAKHAIAIDLSGQDDKVVDLPEKHTEPAGVNGDPRRGEVYIPYDNNKVVHVVSFDAEPALRTIDVPDLGIDATAYDPGTRTLYAAGWKQAALYVLDVDECECTLTVPFFPVYPHMNSMALDRNTKTLYIPTGSAAVNGTFGASVSVFDTNTIEYGEIRTGWAPVCLTRNPGTKNFFVFSTNRDFVEVTPGGICTFHTLPHPYPRQALTDADSEGVWVAYGPHSSWWPNYYINGTRDGIFLVDGQGRVVRNRMTPKLVQNMIQDGNGRLWATQNTWGNEEPFLLTYPVDDARRRLPWDDIRLPPKVDNECVMRLLAQDEKTGILYTGRTGNLNTENGMLYAIDPKTRSIVKEIETGRTPTSLCIAPYLNRVYVTNFDDDTVTLLDTRTGAVKTEPTGGGPLASALDEKTGMVIVVNHREPSLTLFSANKTRAIPLPEEARPNNILVDPTTGYAFVTAQNDHAFRLYRVDPQSGRVETLVRDRFPYGDVSFDQANTAFRVRGQWGDGIFHITDMALDEDHRLWVTDYLGGRLWIVDTESRSSP